MQREFLLWIPIIMTLAVVVTVSKFVGGKTAQMLPDMMDRMMK